MKAVTALLVQMQQPKLVVVAVLAELQAQVVLLVSMARVALVDIPPQAQELILLAIVEPTALCASFGDQIEHSRQQILVMSHDRRRFPPPGGQGRQDG